MGATETIVTSSSRSDNGALPLPPYEGDSKTVTKGFYMKFWGYTLQVTFCFCLVFIPGFLYDYNLSTIQTASNIVVFFVVWGLFMLLITQLSDYFKTPKVVIVFGVSSIVLASIGAFMPFGILRTVFLSFAASCLVTMSCGQFMSMTTHFTLFLTTGASFCVGALLCVLIRFLVPEAILVLIILLPVICFILYLMSFKQYYRYHWVYITRAETKDRTGDMLGAAIISASTGSLMGVGGLTILVEAPLLYPIEAGLCVAVAGAIMVVNVFISEKLDERILLKIYAPVAVIGLLLVMLDSAITKTIGAAILIVFSQLGNITSLNAVAEVARFSSQSPIYAYTSGRFHYCVGVLIGLGVMFLSFFVFTGLYSQAVIMLLLSTTTILETFVFQAHYPKQAGDDVVNVNEKTIGSTRWNKAIESIATEYGLSPRQTEVFEYLARGRNAQFIQDTFVISKGTTKTHIISIYRKLGIHSQQELINLVEEKRGEKK